jgi:hypothetical protein
MTPQRAGLRGASIVFGLFAIGHLLRLINVTPVVVGSYQVPMGVSWVALIIAAALCIWLWQLASGRGTSLDGSHATPMELQQFVAETLNRILKGVSDVQGNNLRNGIKVNPVLTHYTNPKHPEYIGDKQKLPADIVVSRDGNVVVMVDFDVAITVTEGTGTSGGIGVSVGAVGLGAQGQSTKANTSESRVKFRVPIVLPHTETKN